MTRVVQPKEDSDHGAGSRSDAERGEGHQRAEGQPARPDKPVANAAQWPAQSRSEPLDQRWRDAVELRARQCTHSDAGEVRMSVEVTGVPTKRLPVALAPGATRQQPQRWLHAECDAVSEQRLVVPRTLHGK